MNTNNNILMIYRTYRDNIQKCKGDNYFTAKKSYKETSIILFNLEFQK